jgi:hypothetical protein
MIVIRTYLYTPDSTLDNIKIEDFSKREAHYGTLYQMG